MKKLFYLFMVVAIMVIVTSCDSKKSEVKNFVMQFSQSLSENDTAFIHSAYPCSAECDSLSFPVDEKAIQVEEGDTAGIYVVKNNDKELVVTIADDGTMTIVDSRNVFSYAVSKKNFALATGWIEDGMSDSQMAERFADKDFINYLGSTLIKELTNNLRVQDWEYSMSPMEMSARSLSYVPLQFIVVNNTPYDIAAEDYHIDATISYLRVAGVDNQKKEVNGEAIGANSSIKIKYNLSPVYNDPNLFEDVVSEKIALNISEEEALQKYFIPKGGEYKSYLYAKGKQ